MVMHQATYSCFGLELAVESADPDELARLGTLLETLLAVDGQLQKSLSHRSPWAHQGCPSTEPDPTSSESDHLSSPTLDGKVSHCFSQPEKQAVSRLQLQCMPGEWQTPEDPSAQPLYDSPDLCVSRTNCGFRLTNGSSVLDLDLMRGVGCVSLHDDFWRQRPDIQRRFLILGFVMLAHRFERFALHANGVARGLAGCLIVGGSGCGKTTLSLSLIRQGWDHLGDDVVVLRRHGAGIEACATSRGFSCTAETASWFPELFPAAAKRSEKSILFVDGIYLGRQLASCRPRTVLLPVIVSRPTSELIPLDSASALSALIQYSAGIMVDRACAVRQLDVLKELVGQVRTFRLLAGRDVLDAPDRIEDLLEYGVVRG